MIRAAHGALVRLFHRLGKYEFGVLVAFAGIAAGIWLFAFIASEVMSGDTQAFDRRIILAMRNPTDHSPMGPPALLESARDLTALGGATALVLLTVFTSTYLLLDGRKRMALFVYGSVGGGLILSSILKALFHRSRPDIVPYAADVFTTSFPSGHSMLSAVTYLTLGALLARSQRRKRIKAYFLFIAGLLSFLIGLSRIYLGVHWPTDVLAGWTAGASWAIVCWLVARRLQASEAIESERDPTADGPEADY
jgi:undecaprenyl-diphosphatase